MTPHPSTASTTLPAGIMANDKSETGTTEQRMTQAERLNALHKWLYGWCQLAGDTSVIDLMDELRALRQAGIAYPDLPADGIECQEMLCKLEADGRAVRNEPGGTLWRWAPGREKEPVAKQASLF